MSRMSDLERHRIPYDRIDRCWLREQALKALRGERRATEEIK